MIVRKKPNWWLVNSDILQGSASGKILFNVFINGLSKKTEHRLRQLGKSNMYAGGKAALQRALDRLGKWSDRKLEV